MFSLHGLVSGPPAAAVERAPSPKFVVTLDGVDADNLDLEEVEEQRNIVRVQPMRPVQPVMVRLEEEGKVKYVYSLRNFFFLPLFVELLYKDSLTHQNI